jgi:hypothetical protein
MSDTWLKRQEQDVLELLKQHNIPHCNWETTKLIKLFLRCKQQMVEGRKIRERQCPFFGCS